MSNAKENKPRKWLIKEAFIGQESGIRYPPHVTSDLSYASYEKGMIHVIEHSAYLALQAENEKLKDANKKLLEGLEKYGCHTEKCCCHIGHQNYENYCDCGFDEFTSEADKIERGE